MRIVRGVTFDFSTASDSSLDPGERVLVVSDPVAFEVRYGAGFPVIGIYTGGLKNSGDLIAMALADGTTIQSFTFDDGWYPSTDGGGFSLEITDDAGPTASWDLAASWEVSEAGGTPGSAINASESGLPTTGSVVINEILTHSDEAVGDWVELFNTTSGIIDIGGWFLSDDPGTPLKYQIEAGTVIGAGQYLIFSNRDHFGVDSADPGALIPFGLSEAGDEVVLSSAADGVATGYPEEEDYAGADREVTFGRHALSTGDFVFTTLAMPTMGAANSGPRIGSVVINELQYNPVSGHEYIELYNASTTRKLFYDVDYPENTWRIDSGVDFTFPMGFYLESGEYVILVAFDPAMAPTELESFLILHEVPAGVSVLGPYQGGLKNGGERVTLSRPGSPETAPAPDSSDEVPSDGSWELFRYWTVLGNFNSIDGPHAITIPDGFTATLDVTDWSLTGDMFHIYDNGVGIGTTSEVPVTSAAITLDPNVAFEDSRWSSGSLELAAGPHSLDFKVVQLNEQSLLGGGFFRVTLSSGLAPYIAEDSVKYGDKSPWPTEPDGKGPSLGRLSASVVGGSLSPYDIWLRSFYDVVDLADRSQRETLWGNDVDQDSDGFPLLLEYVMALEPDRFDEGVVFDVTAGSTSSTLFIRRSKTASGVTLRLLYSDDELATWQPISFNIESTEDHVNWELIKASVNMGFDDSTRLFFQLEAIR